MGCALKGRKCVAAGRGILAWSGATDAERLVAELNASAGIDVRLTGVAALGVVSGAAYVRWPDGHESVVTRSHATAGTIALVGDVLAAARSGGAPVPRYELVAELADSRIIVQERLPGSPAGRIDDATIVAVLGVNERFAGLLSDRPDVPASELFLREGGPDFCVHETLAAYDDRSRKLLAWIREVGRSAPDSLPGDDLLHWDLVPGNILLGDAGEITGIVDWDGIGRGDRCFSLIKLRFSLERGARLRPDAYPAVEAGALARLDEHLRNAVDPETFRICWAHWSLSMVDWAIRHNPRASSGQGPVELAWLENRDR